MPLLLTGAGGLVGSRLLPRLVEAGVDCRALVRRDVDLPAGVTAVRGDLSDPDSLRDAAAGVDAVVHLAATFRTEDEDAIWRSNLDGARNLIEATLAHAPGARFVLASTINVYDADQARPGRETDAATPTAAYPASKLAAEGVLRESDLTWAILRFPFIYGDGDGHVEMIPAMATRFGMHPASGFSALHHRDVAVAVRLALTGATDGAVVNVADDKDVTIHELATLAGSPIEPSSEPLANPWSGRADTSLARSLGFAPTVATINAAARDGLL